MGSSTATAFAVNLAREGDARMAGRAGLRALAHERPLPQRHGQELTARDGDMRSPRAGSGPRHQGPQSSTGHKGRREAGPRCPQRTRGVGEGMCPAPRVLQASCGLAP